MGLGATTTDVRGIHNIDFEVGCTSARTAVVATVGQNQQLQSVTNAFL